jgi:hypothetical protein
MMEENDPEYKAKGGPLHGYTCLLEGAGMFEETSRALWYTEQRCSQPLDIHPNRGALNLPSQH